MPPSHLVLMELQEVQDLQEVQVLQEHQVLMVLKGFLETSQPHLTHQFNLELILQILEVQQI